MVRNKTKEIKMFNSKQIKSAWIIRRESAVKFGCGVMEISWKECLKMSKEEKSSDVYDECFEFVEKILTVEDQKKLSKEWYGDANYSDTEFSDIACVESGYAPNETLVSKKVNDDDFYSTSRHWTDEEMDLYL